MTGKIIDLTRPIETNHFRWPVERRTTVLGGHGEVPQATWIGLSVHGFTHMDAGSHFDVGGYTTDDVDLQQVIGAAAVIDLGGIAANSPVTATMLADAAAHLRPGMIALMATRWDQRRCLEKPEFWTEAPYMTTEACRWLVNKEIRAIAFDFPQDKCIRDMVTGDRHPELQENITHFELLLRGIPMFEYICNTGALSKSEVEFFGLPIKLPRSDGAPARVIAIEAGPDSEAEN